MARGAAIARAERTTADPFEAPAGPDMDAVVIVTPTSTHAALIEAAVLAGKAVLSEKPIALDLAETERVVQVIATTGQPVQLGFRRRYDPGCVRARERIEAGELGRLEVFQALSRDTTRHRWASCARAVASSSTWRSMTSTWCASW